MSSIVPVPVSGVVSEESPAGTGRRKVVLAPGVHFSPRERELVCLVADGYSNKEIGVALNLRLQTVKNHLSRIYRKLGITRRVELAVFAVGHGLVTPDGDM